VEGAMFYTQENRILTIDTPLGEDVLLLTDLSGIEGISMLFSYELTLVSPNKDIDFKSIIGQPVTVSINLHNGEYRYINGIVTRFSQGEGGMNEKTGQALASYSATLSPLQWLLDRTCDCEIFQNLSVPKIAEKVLKDNGLKDYRFDVKESYPSWEYCVQYNESDLHFISRLLEEEGICYYFEHENGKHTLVLTDKKDCHKKCPNQETARYKLNSDTTREDEVIDSLFWGQEIRHGVHAIKDFNFKSPYTDLAATVPAKHDIGPGERETYFYSSGHDTIGEGKRVAKIRMEEDAAQVTSISGSSDCRAFASGYRFKLQDYYRSDMNEKEYLLTTIKHEVSEPLDDDSEFSYSNSFNCIPFDVQYRPPWITQKPLMRGSQTATVTGPKGQEIYVDKHGRVKVQFHWDRYGKKDENTSCWIRVSYPSASKGFGFQSHPRIGDEVIVDFLEGDPDRPIITGSVYNGSNPTPYTLPDHKTRSTMKSNSSIGGGGYNEFRFEDLKGSEEVYLQAQKDYNVLVKNNRTETVYINKAETIGAAKELTIGGLYQVTVGGAMNESVGLAKTEEVGLNKTVLVGKSFNITAADSFSITCGSSKITMKKNGDISISGNNINIKGSKITEN
jgi:type VI secretion system secreted protein VgrG